MNKINRDLQSADEPREIEIPDNLRLVPTEEEQQAERDMRKMETIASGLAGRQEEAKRKMDALLASTPESNEGEPKLPNAKNLLAELGKLDKKGQDALIAKLAGKRVYRFNKEGKREYVSLGFQKKADGTWDLSDISLTTYNENGALSQTKKIPKPDAITYRHWQRPKAEKLPNIGDEVIYRDPAGKILKGKYMGMDESGTITLTVGKDTISLQADNLLTYENNRRAAFTLRVPGRPIPTETVAPAAVSNPSEQAAAQVAPNKHGTAAGLESGEAKGEGIREGPEETQRKRVSKILGKTVSNEGFKELQKIFSPEGGKEEPTEHEASTVEKLYTKGVKKLLQRIKKQEERIQELEKGGPVKRFFGKLGRWTKNVAYYGVKGFATPVALLIGATGGLAQSLWSRGIKHTPRSVWEGVRGVAKTLWGRGGEEEEEEESEKGEAAPPKEKRRGAASTETAPRARPAAAPSINTGESVKTVKARNSKKYDTLQDGRLKTEEVDGTIGRLKGRIKLINYSKSDDRAVTGDVESYDPKTKTLTLRRCRLERADGTIEDRDIHRIRWSTSRESANTET